MVGISVFDQYIFALSTGREKQAHILPKTAEKSIGNQK
jgi:hypothetical protein